MEIFGFDVGTVLSFRGESGLPWLFESGSTSKCSESAPLVRFYHSGTRIILESTPTPGRRGRGHGDELRKLLSFAGFSVVFSLSDRGASSKTITTGLNCRAFFCRWACRWLVSVPPPSTCPPTPRNMPPPCGPSRCARVGGACRRCSPARATTPCPT